MLLACYKLYGKNIIILRQYFFALELCTLPMETGPCKAAFLKWYYNPDDNKCHMFTYGGLQGMTIDSTHGMNVMQNV